MNVLKLQLKRRKDSDLFAIFLINRLHLNPVKFGLLSAVLSSLLFIFSGLVSRTLESDLGKAGLLDEWLHWFFVLIINPSIFGYYLWSSLSIIGIVEKLEKSDLIETDHFEIENILLVYKKKNRIYISLFISTLYSIYFFISRADLSGWTSSGFIPRISGSILSFLVGFAASMLVANLILNIVVLNRIFLKKKLSINLLHPDKCGGLAFLGSYSLRTAYLISMFGAWLIIAVYDFQDGRFNHGPFLLFILLPLYVALSLLTFLSPLFSVHTGMKSVKFKNLETISCRYQELYELTRNNMDLELKELRGRIDRLKNIKELYVIAEKFPVWPFDMPMISRYFVSILGVFLPFLLDLLHSKL